MGLGKTTELIVLPVERQLVLAYRAHLNARDNGIGSHLSKGTVQNPQDEDAVCQSATMHRSGSISCLRVDESLTAKLLPKLETTLIVVSPSLLSTGSKNLRRWYLCDS